MYYQQWLDLGLQEQVITHNALALQCGILPTDADKEKIKLISKIYKLSNRTPYYSCGYNLDELYEFSVQRLTEILKDYFGVV